MLASLLGLVLLSDPFPGVVVDHVRPKSGLRIGSPSLAILPNGDYVASEDLYDAKNQAKGLRVFRSGDRGQSWSRVASLKGAFWSGLFVHDGELYLMGTNGEYGDLVIRRSLNGGATWSAPSVLITGQVHTAPVPVIESGGRLWRGYEQRDPPKRWATNFRAGVLSASVDADLTDPASWTSTNLLRSWREWNGGDMGGWLEGNAVATPAGVVDVLRVETKHTPERAAIIRVSRDGRRATFDPEHGFVAMPGAAKKFTIRFDPSSRLYWTLATEAPDGAMKPAKLRNALMLASSPDLARWTVREVVLRGDSVRRTGFQYADWQFDSDDIVAVVRTARRVGKEKPKDAQSANFLTFHRIADFRERR